MAIKISGTTVIHNNRAANNFTHIKTSGFITATGNVTANSFVGDGSQLTNAGATIASDTAASRSLFVPFTGISSGALTSANVNSFFTFNPATGALTANSFSGDGSALTGIASGGGNFNTSIANSVGYAVTTTWNAAFTAPATAGKRYVIHSLHVTNIDGVNNADISGGMYASNSSFAHTVQVPAGAAVELFLKPKVLSPSESLYLQASTNSDLHATLAYEIVDGTSHFGSGIDITGDDTYQDLHTATSVSVIESILLANDDGVNDIKATVVWTDGSNNIQGYYAYELIVPADSTVELLESPKSLPNGYKVRVKGQYADRLEAIIAGKAS